MSSFVADTHALARYLTGDSQLGKNAQRIFELAENGAATILVPTIVLAELLYIIEKKNIKAVFSDVITQIQSSKNFLAVPLTLNVIEECVRIQTVPEMHDRIIAATAKLMQAKVLGKDPHIKSAVETIW